MTDDTLIQNARKTLDTLRTEIETLHLASFADGWWTCHRQVLDYLEQRVTASTDSMELTVLQAMAEHMRKMVTTRPTK